MFLKHRQTNTLIFLVIFLLIGCGGHGGSNGASGTAALHDQVLFNNKKTGPITQPAKDAVESSLVTAMSALDSEPAATEAQAVVAQMQKMPQFQQGGITADGNVWGRYTDGSPILFEINDPGIGSSPRASSDRKPTRQVLSRNGPSAIASPATDELPATNIACVFNAMEASRESPTPQIADELAAAGYQVTFSTGSLADWSHLQNVALLVNDSHGGVFQDAYEIESSDLATDDAIFQHAAQIAAQPYQIVPKYVRVYSDATHYTRVRHLCFSSEYLTSQAASKTEFSKSLYVNSFYRFVSSLIYGTEAI